MHSKEPLSNKKGIWGLLFGDRASICGFGWNTQARTPDLNSAVKNCNFESSVYFNHQLINFRLPLSGSHCMYFTWNSVTSSFCSLLHSVDML